MSTFSVPFSRRIVAGAAVLLLAPMLVVLPGHDPEADAADQDFTFEGGGFGHTVGLSQYGAYGMAKLDGATSAQILAHYFTGTSTDILGAGARAAEPLWVNLENEAKSLTLRPRAIKGSGTPLVVTRDGTTYTVPVGSTIRIRIVQAGVCRVTMDGFDATGTCNLDLTWDGEKDKPSTRVAINRVNYTSANSEGSRCELLDWNAAPSVYRECAYAHGELHIRPDGDSAAFHLALEIDVDDYALGISEMPYYWGLSGGYEALEAQAIAARSYAISRQIERGNPANRPGCWCQVADTGVDQRYVGWGHSGLGQQEWLDAVRTTDGVVVTHPDVQQNGKKIAIGALYGSSSYGRTEPSATVYGTNRPYLQSVDDHWGLDPAVGNPRATWAKTLSGATLATAVGIGGGRKVVDAEIVECSPSGAAHRVRFTDDAGNTTVRSTQSLRSLLGLSSPQVSAINGVTPCDGLGDDGGGGGGTPSDLTALAIEIDDDARGDSSGNNDGRAQCDETIELRTRIGNDGDARATRVTAALETTDRYLSIVHNDTSDFPDINPNGTGINRNDWDLAIDSGVPVGHVAKLTLRVTNAEGGPTTLEYDLPIECDGGPGPGAIEALSITIDDGTTGDSIGNNDRRAQCGETIELYVTLRNQTGLTLRSLSADFSTTDSKVTLLHNADSAYPDLSNGATARNQNDWDMRIAGSTPDGHTVSATVTVTAAGGGLWAVPIEIPVECDGGGGDDTSTDLVIGGITVDDGVRGDSIGNNDKRAQCGETIELYVALENTGSAAATGLNAEFTSTDAYLRLIHNTSSPYPDLGPGASRDNSNDWDMVVSANAPNGHNAPFTLTLTNSSGERVALNGTVRIECGDDGGGGGGGGGGTGEVTLRGMTVDDGVRGDSIGNNDKQAQCGETIELYLAIENQGGDTLRGVTAELIDRSAQAGILYNTASGYGDIGAGRFVENDNDWDIRVAAAATGTMSFRLKVTASGGATWELPIEVPVSCR